MEESQYVSNIPRGVNVTIYHIKMFRTGAICLYFKVLIHEKYDYPIMSLHGINVLAGNDITVTLKPEVLVSDNEIRGLKIKQRACLFDNEVIHKFVYIYAIYH